MADFDQQIVSPDEHAQPVRRRLPAIPIDSYTLLLVVGLIVLIISLAYLAVTSFRYYGLFGSPGPAFGKVTAVSDRGIQIDIGAKQGLVAGQKLLAKRRGVFLADLSVKTVQPDAATASVPDGTTEIITRGDTVVFSPLDSKP